MMESEKQEANLNKDSPSDTDSSVDLKRKTPANKIAIVDYRVRDEDETYESSSSDEYFQSSSMSSSSSVSSASSLEPLSQQSRKPNDNKEKKKESWKDIKTKGEMSLDDLPRIEDLHLNVLEDDLKIIGKISAIVDRLVVVQSEKGLPALDMDSVLFLNFDKPLGQVFDTFGPVSCPYYCVRFNSGGEIKEKGIKVGVDVFFAPGDEEITNYVLYQEIRQEKGSDASWKNNNEPPVECLDFSDDETEISARQKKKGKRTLGNNTVNSSAQTSQSAASAASVVNRAVSKYRPAMAKEQSFTGPSQCWFRQNRMSSHVSSVSRPVMHNPVPNSQLTQPYYNALRSQVNLAVVPPPMVHNTSPNFASNQVVSLCMVNMARPPPPLFTNVASQPPHNVSTPFSNSVGSHNYTANQQCANIQPSFNNGTFNQVLSMASSMAPHATSPRQQSYGQSLQGIGNTMLGARPVFASPPIFNLFCLPPPPPPVPDVGKSAISKPQVNFMRQPMSVASQTMSQISATNSSQTLSLTSSDTYGNAAMFNRYPMSNNSPTVQPTFYMPFSAASVSRPNDFSASVPMFPAPAQFSSPPPARCGISPYPANVQPAPSQIQQRYPPSVASQPSSFFLQ